MQSWRSYDRFGLSYRQKAQTKPGPQKSPTGQTASTETALPLLTLAQQAGCQRVAKWAVSRCKKGCFTLQKGLSRITKQPFLPARTGKPYKRAPVNHGHGRLSLGRFSVIAGAICTSFTTDAVGTSRPTSRQRAMPPCQQAHSAPALASMFFMYSFSP